MEVYALHLDFCYKVLHFVVNREQKEIKHRNTAIKIN